MSYAQQQYDTYDEAKAALFVDMASHKTPVEFSKGILLAQIVVQKGASSWGVSAEIFPLAASTSSGSGSGSAANAINVAYTDTYALGNNVQSALDNLAALKLTTDQHAALAAASGGTYPPTGTNAIATVDDVGVNTDILVAHIDGSNYRHNATAIDFIPAGDLAATDVDGALVELDAEKLAAVDMVGAIGRINDPLIHMPLAGNLAMTQGNGQANFERESEASYVDRNGLLIFVGPDVPRFEANGLLVEGVRSNLLLQSNNFNEEAAWTKHGGVTNAASIPGTNPAGIDSVVQIKNEGGTSSSFGVYQDVLNVGVQTSFSVWARASRNGMKLRLGADGVPSEVTLTTEWVRHKIEDYTVGSTLFVLFAIGSGDTEEYFEIAYSQAENAPFVSSYIFNKADILTREADRISVTSQDNCTAGISSNSISMELDILGDNSPQVQYLFNFNGDSERNIEIQAGSDPTINYAGATAMMAVTDLINDPHQFAWTYDETSGSLGTYLNGALVSTGAITPTGSEGPTEMTLMNNAHTQTLNTFGHIKNFRLWDVALTASEMEMI